MASKRYTGGCHCGAVRYEARLDLSQGTGKCNCTFCAKVRNWTVMFKPDAFRLLRGEEALGDYSRHPAGHNRFCKHCGVRTFSHGNIPELGGDFVTIQLSTLEDASPEELIAAPVRYFNGRDNDWMNTPRETRHL